MTETQLRNQLLIQKLMNISDSHQSSHVEIERLEDCPYVTNISVNAKIGHIKAGHVSICSRTGPNRVDDSYSIEWVDVLPIYQRKGIATKMISIITEKLVGARIEVIVGNAHLVPVFERLGVRCTRTPPIRRISYDLYSQSGHFTIKNHLCNISILLLVV